MDRTNGRIGEDITGSSSPNAIPLLGDGCRSQKRKYCVFPYGFGMPIEHLKPLSLIGWHMHTSTISVLGFSIRVATTLVSEPRRPLLLFNGIGASIELVAPFTEAMRRVGIPCLVFDIPGVGGSERTLKPYRFSDLAKLANAILDESGIHGSVDVLGVSWGGALAQQFAKDFPDRCARLVLAATSAGAVMVPGRLGVILNMVSPRRYTDPDFMARAAGSLYGGDLRDQPGLSDLLLRGTEPPSKIGYIMQLLAGAGWTSIHWLRRVRQPVLVMIGKHDPIVPPINGRILAALLPNARLVEIDCGHLFMLTRPDQVAAIIDSFLQDAPNTADAEAATLS
jgi:poly(3-hydroxyalkanoate) depolymerase